MKEGETMSKKRLMVLGLFMAMSACRGQMEMRIKGIAAFIPQNDPKHPMAVIMPKISAGNSMPAHIPYVAWQEGDEVELADGAAGKVQRKTDPSDHSEWRVYTLDYEALVIPDEFSSRNPVLAMPVTNVVCTTNSSDAGCLPTATDFITGSHPYKPEYVKRVNPTKDIASRFELSDIGTLTSKVKDTCKWKITMAGSANPITKNLASEGIYTVELRDSTLHLQLRKLNESAAHELVNLRHRGGPIEIRYGNAVDVFPPKKDHIDTGQTDPHFNVYYDFLQGVTAADFPVLLRTSSCGGSVDEFVVCGGGYVIGKDKADPR